MPTLRRARRTRLALIALLLGALTLSACDPGTAGDSDALPAETLPENGPVGGTHTNDVILNGKDFAGLGYSWDGFLSIPGKNADDAEWLAPARDEYARNLVFSLKAARNSASGPADYFNEQTAGHATATGTTTDGKPGDLNFSYCGDLHIKEWEGSSIPLCLGQGHKLGHNNWWIGGPTFLTKSGNGICAADPGATPTNAADAYRNLVVCVRKNTASDESLPDLNTFDAYTAGEDNWVDFFTPTPGALSWNTSEVLSSFFVPLIVKNCDAVIDRLSPEAIASNEEIQNLAGLVAAGISEAGMPEQLAASVISGVSHYVVLACSGVNGLAEDQKERIQVVTAALEGPLGKAKATLAATAIVQHCSSADQALTDAQITTVVESLDRKLGALTSEQTDEVVSWLNSVVCVGMNGSDAVQEESISILHEALTYDNYLASLLDIPADEVLAPTSWRFACEESCLRGGDDGNYSVHTNTVWGGIVSSNTADGNVSDNDKNLGGLAVKELEHIDELASFSVNAVADRSGSDDVAHWFADQMNADTPEEHMIAAGTTHDAAFAPNKLNFAFCGTLEPSYQTEEPTASAGPVPPALQAQESPLCLGQGHREGSQNNWWVGGPDWTYWGSVQVSAAVEAIPKNYRWLVKTLNLGNDTPLNILTNTKARSILISASAGSSAAGYWIDDFFMILPF